MTFELDASELDMLWAAVKGVLGSFKDNVLEFFGIHSPARWGVFVGNMIDVGVANGVIGKLPLVNAAANKLTEMASSPFSEMKMGYTVSGDSSGNSGEAVNRLDTLITLLRVLIENRQNGNETLSNRELIRALRDMGVVFA